MDGQCAQNVMKIMCLRVLPLGRAVFASFPSGLSGRGKQLKLIIVHGVLNVSVCCFENKKGELLLLKKNSFRKRVIFHGEQTKTHNCCELIFVRILKGNNSLVKFERVPFINREPPLNNDHTSHHTMTHKS